MEGEICIFSSRWISDQIIGMDRDRFEIETPSKTGVEKTKYLKNWHRFAESVSENVEFHSINLEFIARNGSKESPASIFSQRNQHIISQVCYKNTGKKLQMGNNSPPLR